MSEKMAVEFEGVGKMYRLYKSRMESFLDITSLGRVSPWWNPKIENFWALRNVSFKLNAGSRLGIIGRNGAGKTTLLKLMTGNIPPTEGHIQVQGEVQALLEAGAGFHPEFSGYENIEASLIQNGLNRSQIKAAVEDIAEFTELGDFLNQPFKTYSAGMQARLVFTTATTIRPEILIIDEILGAGDAYFAVKSRSRMKQLVDSGASILLVAHAMDQILQFCEEAIWLERGRIVLRGPSLEVVKAYEEFIHTLQDRQLKAANRQRKLGFRDAVEVGHFADNFVVAIDLGRSRGFACRRQHGGAAIRRQRGNRSHRRPAGFRCHAFCLRLHEQLQLGRTGRWKMARAFAACRPGSVVPRTRSASWCFAPTRSTGGSSTRFAFVTGPSARGAWRSPSRAMGRH